MSAWPIIGSFPILFLLAALPGRSPGKKLLDIVSVPLLEGQFPVDIVVRRDGVAYGHDQGIVTFVDGWLCFEGQATDFAIRSSDVRPVVPSWVSQGHDLRFSYWCEGIGAWKGSNLGIQPFRLGKRWKHLGIVTNRRAFHRAFSEWSRTQVAPEGAPVYPPIAPHPLAYRRLWPWLGICAAFVLIAGASAMLNLLHPSKGDALISSWVIVGTTTFNGALYFSFYLFRRKVLADLQKRADSLPRLESVTHSSGSLL